MISSQKSLRKMWCPSAPAATYTLGIFRTAQVTTPLDSTAYLRDLTRALAVWGHLDNLPCNSCHPPPGIKLQPACGTAAASMSRTSIKRRRRCWDIPVKGKKMDEVDANPGGSRTWTCKWKSMQCEKFKENILNFKISPLHNFLVNIYKILLI